MQEQSLNQKFKALADENRRAILFYLKNGRKCAGDIAKQFVISPPSVSYHLSVLEKSHLISSVHLKGFIYYSLNVNELGEVVEWLSQFKRKQGR